MRQPSSTGTITQESASINTIDNPTGTQLCDGEDFNGANALNIEFSNAAGLEINQQLLFLGAFRLDYKVDSLIDT